MKRQVKLLVTSVFVVCVLSVFGIRGARSHEGPEFGDPLDGLYENELALFEAGKEDFEEVEEPDEGLGPLFNARSCGECHALAGVGGAGVMNEVRAGRIENNVFTDLPGGSLFQLFSVGGRRCQESIPDNANVMAFRQATPLFGSGLIEAIPDLTIQAQADPNDQNRDGISGRVHMVLDVATNRMRVGRFGWKAQQASLLGFSADAYLNEMGITSDLAPFENAPNGDAARLRDCDNVPDPEDRRDPKTGRRGIDNFENFMRFLGPPPRGAITAVVMRGESLFTSVGCAMCHTPGMQTGDNAIAALSRKPVPLFSDLLLHDVGTGDSIAQGGAGTDEIRTAPLWGLRMSAPYLHDGSAVRIEDAIARHAGESKTIIARYSALSATDKRDLVAFLLSL